MAFHLAAEKNPFQTQAQMSERIPPGFSPETAGIYNVSAADHGVVLSSSGGRAVQSMPPAHGLTIDLGEPPKRRRGRPRKYNPDGSMNLRPHHVSPKETIATTGKKRGRPPGSGSKQKMVAFGSAGIGFTPHIFTVNAGEDVTTKIMSFCQQGPRGICIISANGVVSSATLRQVPPSGEAVTYEGPFEILSCSGSYVSSKTNGRRHRTGGLTVSLAGVDGRIFGGGVAGIMLAASPVQVIVGSFIADHRAEEKEEKEEKQPSQPSSPTAFDFQVKTPPRTGASPPHTEPSVAPPVAPLNRGGSGGVPFSWAQLDG